MCSFLLLSSRLASLLPLLVKNNNADVRVYLHIEQESEIRLQVVIGDACGDAF